MKKRNLTTQQKMFVFNILEGMNQTDAYLNAGYKCYRSAARRNAARLMTNADIKQKIEKILGRAAEKAEITHQMILEQYAKIAFLILKICMTIAETSRILMNWMKIPWRLLPA